MRETLSTMRERGIKLFLVGDSHFSYTDLVMTASIGKEWQSLFDIIILNSKKPLFQRSENPFFSFDENSKNNKGAKVTNASELSDGKIFLEGNGTILSEYF